MTDFDYNPPDGPLVVLHEDAQILVLDKPSGLLSVPGKLAGRRDCLMSRVVAAYWDALLVHRLDCDTSGVMIFARTKTAQGFLSQEFEKRRAQKNYVARVWGRLTPDHGQVDLPICVDWQNRPRQMIDNVNGRSAKTDWRVIERHDNETRVHLSPLTGRSHQLRVHMLALGHPILGDRIYSEGAALAFDRLMLHARSLSLHHPQSGDRVTFECPCPF